MYFIIHKNITKYNVFYALVDKHCMKLAVVHFMETFCSVFGSNKTILFSIKRIIKIKNISYLGLIIESSLVLEIDNQIPSCSEKKDAESYSSLIYALYTLALGQSCRYIYV